MMRLTWATFVATLLLAPTALEQTAPAQQPTAQQPTTPSYAKQPLDVGIEGNMNPAARVATQTRPAAATQPAGASPGAAPFAPLEPAALAKLQHTLLAWEKQSQGTKTLDCKFKRWHYDMFAAPSGVHATRADGVIKYAEPDKGLFRVDRLVFFAGMVEDKPQFKEQPGQYGEHWVCNGTQLIEFDRDKEECRIQDLPPEMQGKNIISSPLPFVFNLDATQIQTRYWIRQVEAPKPGIVLIEAWPKRQEDRAQYKLVQIALDDKNYLPQALLMYAPNFDAKTAPKWDHYEFLDMKRNAIGAGFQKFLGNFIPEKPPASWKILRDKFIPPVEPPAGQAVQQAANPGELRR